MRQLLAPLRALLAGGVLAAPALACPTSSDMEKGIVFNLAGGGFELHQSTRPEWVEIYAEFAEGEGSLLEMYHGLYLYRDVPVQNDDFLTEEEQFYGTLSDVTKWAKPRPDARWENLTPFGGMAGASAVKSLRIGGCTYESFDVTLIYADDLGYSETYSYIPSLGTGLLVRAGDVLDTETYRYTGVRALN